MHAGPQHSKSGQTECPNISEHSFEAPLAGVCEASVKINVAATLAPTIDNHR